jgi:short-subunit dehydrogenase
MKKILVVGAGSGIGKALFDNLKKRKDILPVGISRRGKPFESNKPFAFHKNYRCDLLNLDEIKKFVAYYSTNHSDIDSIYLCQGNGLFDKISDISMNAFEQHLSLNLTSNFILMQKFFSALKNSKKNPLVCFLSSTAGKIGFPDSTAYCASKHAVAGFAKSLREEWKSENIRVFTVYPGAISTEIWSGRKGFSKDDMISPSDFAKYLISLTDLPASIVVDESTVLPIKGIL